MRLASPAPVALIALLSLQAACGPGLPKVDPSPLSVCVLQGATVADGCATDTDGAPALLFGTVAFGRFVTKVVVIRSAFDGAAAEVSQVRLDGSPPANLGLELFTLSGGVETAAALPLSLPPRGSQGDELRARVTFEADPAGALSGVSLAVVSGGKQTALPIGGEGLDRASGPFSTVSCTGDPACSISSIDVCAVLPDLRAGDDFTVAYSNVGSNWSSSHASTATFKRGTASEHVDATSGRKYNVTALGYDGACALGGYSAYRGDSTEFSSCVLQVTALAYVIP